MKFNHNIIHFDAKIPKTLVIKEKTLINQRKSHTKKSFTNQILYFFGHQATQVTIRNHFIGAIHATRK